MPYPKAKLAGTEEELRAQAAQVATVGARARVIMIRVGVGGSGEDILTYPL